MENKKHQAQRAYSMRLAGQTGWRTAWDMRDGLGVFWNFKEINEMSILLNEKEKYQRR
jgi:hypothetical protein